MRRYRKQRKPRRKYWKRTQKGGFLNRYDFAYAGGDTVNQVGKIAPGLIKNTSPEINNIAQQRMNEIISQGGKEVERILSKIFRRILWRCLPNTLLDAREIWKTTTSKTKKQDITLNKYLISLTVFYMKSKSLYIFKLQIYINYTQNLNIFSPLIFFKYFVYSMDSFRPADYFFPVFQSQPE